MNIDFSHLSLEELQKLYFRADAELKNSLLQGADWNEVREKRKAVTQLAIELHRKKQMNTSPADTPFRSK